MLPDLLEPRLVPDRPANAFLRSLSASAFGVLSPHLGPVEMKHGETLYRPDDRIDWIYFPLNSLLSVLTTTGEGETVETASVGNEGALGVLEACGSGRSAMISLVQIDGSALRAPSAVFRRLVSANDDLNQAA